MRTRDDELGLDHPGGWVRDPATGTPGRSTVTARMPASSRSIARAVAAELSDIAPHAGDRIARAAEGAGHALPSSVRGAFESSLGADLGGVRVHTDGAAADAASALGARAFATGQDVFMGAGQYAPDTDEGRFLLAHEVAHTVQQRGSAADPQCKLEVSEPGDASELEADTAAVAMMSGLPARVTTAGGVARRIARTGTEEPRRGGEPRETPASFAAGHETPPRTFHITGEQSFVSIELEMRLRGRAQAGQNGEHHHAVGATVLGSDVGAPARREEGGGVETSINTSREGVSAEEVGGLRAALPRLFDRIHPGVRDSIGFDGGEHVGGHLGLVLDLGELGGHPVAARFNLVRRSAGEHPRLEFASLTLSTSFDLASFRLQQEDGSSLNVALTVPVEIHISPNWTRIGRYLLERFGVQLAGEAAPAAVATGGAGAATAPTGAAAAEGGAGGAGGGTAGAGGAGETVAAGGGVEAGIELAISAGFIAGAIVTIAATIGSLVEIDDADGSTRQIPGVAGQLASGFMLGLEGHDEPADRTQAVGWERGDAERTRIVETTAREHPGTRPEDYAGAVTDLARARYQALHAQARQRFWRLAQAIVWHGYARRQTTRHALDLGWRYIWQGADDPEVQRLYHQYADRL